MKGKLHNLASIFYFQALTKQANMELTRPVAVRSVISVISVRETENVRHVSAGGSCFHF